MAIHKLCITLLLYIYVYYMGNRIKIDSCYLNNNNNNKIMDETSKIIYLIRSYPNYEITKYKIAG